MSWTSAIVVYVVAWWLIFFMLLPLGVRPPHELGEAAGPGHEAGAPVRPHLWKKALAATILAALLWGLVFWAIGAGLVSFRNG